MVPDRQKYIEGEVERLESQLKREDLTKTQREATERELKFTKIAAGEEPEKAGIKVSPPSSRDALKRAAEKRDAAKKEDTVTVDVDGKVVGVSQGVAQRIEEEVMPRQQAEIMRQRQIERGIIKPRPEPEGSYSYLFVTPARESPKPQESTTTVRTTTDKRPEVRTTTERKPKTITTVKKTEPEPKKSQVLRLAGESRDLTQPTTLTTTKSAKSQPITKPTTLNIPISKSSKDNLKKTTVSTTTVKTSDKPYEDILIERAQREMIEKEQKELEREVFPLSTRFRETFVEPIPSGGLWELPKGVVEGAGTFFTQPIESPITAYQTVKGLKQRTKEVGFEQTKKEYTEAWKSLPGAFVTSVAENPLKFAGSVAGSALTSYGISKGIQKLRPPKQPEPFRVSTLLEEEVLEEPRLGIQKGKIRRTVELVPDEELKVTSTGPGEKLVVQLIEKQTQVGTKAGMSGILREGVFGEGNAFMEKRFTVPYNQEVPYVKFNIKERFDPTQLAGKGTLPKTGTYKSTTYQFPEPLPVDESLASMGGGLSSGVKTDIMKFTTKPPPPPRPLIVPGVPGIFTRQNVLQDLSDLYSGKYEEPVVQKSPITGFVSKSEEPKAEIKVAKEEPVKVKKTRPRVNIVDNQRYIVKPPGSPVPGTPFMEVKETLPSPREGIVSLPSTRGSLISTQQTGMMSKSVQGQMQKDYVKSVQGQMQKIRRAQVETTMQLPRVSSMLSQSQVSLTGVSESPMMKSAADTMNMRPIVSEYSESSLMLPKKTKVEAKPMEGFDVFVRKTGKWFKATEKPLFKGEAMKFGAEIAETTPRASFKLVQSKDQPVPTKIPYMFRPMRFRAPKKKGVKSGEDIFIEKSKFRIDTPGELKGITYKGIMAPRKKKSTPKKRRKKGWWEL